MPEVKFEVDVDSAPDEQPGANPFNRWHPDIPAAVEAEPGETIRLEALDWTGGQITDEDDPNEVRDVDLTQVHYLAGPVHVHGAEPGDLLKVEFHDMGPLNNRSEFGFTGTFSQKNGGGFLTDHFPTAAKSVWDIDGYTVSSRHIPDVRYEGKIHPGLAGCAPSRELLERWNEREQELIDKYEDKWGSQKGENTPVLAAMIETLDKSVGRIRNALKEAGIEENTIFIFYSENGGLERSAVQTPFRRGKGWLYEGGIRVPLIVRWDGQIEEGSQSDALVTSNDMYPTLLNMAGIPVEKEILDGKNVFPVLKGEKESVRNTLYWHYPHYHGGSGMKPGGAMRMGDYKLIVWYEKLLMDTSDPYELYNVSQDKGETVDLKDELPGKAEEMKKEFDKWKEAVDAQMPKVK